MRLWRGEAPIEREVQVRVRVRRRRPRINVCPRACGRVPSLLPFPSFPPPRLSARPFEETRKKCVCFISNGSRPVERTDGRTDGRTDADAGSGVVVRRSRRAVRFRPRPRPRPPLARRLRERPSDRPPSELILSIRSFVRFGVSLQFRRRRRRRRAAARSVRLPRKSRDLIDQT